jgi:hypothetical protein
MHGAFSQKSHRYALLFILCVLPYSLFNQEIKDDTILAIKAITTIRECFIAREKNIPGSQNILLLKKALRFSRILKDCIPEENLEQHVEAVIMLINQQLIENPYALSFLKYLNESNKGDKKLSEDEIAAILKNTGLLLPLKELFFIAEIIALLKNKYKSSLFGKKLYTFLNQIELDEQSTPLDLWERKNSLSKRYAMIQAQTSEISDKIYYLKKYDRIKKNIQNIIELLKCTEEYGKIIERIDSIEYSQKKLHQLYENAFCGIKECITFEAYLQSIAKDAETLW